MKLIASLPSEFWTGFFGALSVIGAALIPAVVTLVTTRRKRNEDKDAREKESKERKELHDDVKVVADKVDEVKVEGGNRENRLADKIDENTTITTDLKNKLDSISDQRAATVLARKDGIPAYYKVTLPGVDYEEFKWSTGSLVEWKSEYCERGRQVRYRVTGPCEMGFHFHEIAEIMFGVAGTLFLEIGDITVELNAGDTFTAAADAVHAARFEKTSVFPGEVVVHWPDLSSNILEVGVFLQ